MKARAFLLVAAIAALAFTGCKKTAISITEGTGSIVYDETRYLLNISTVATSKNTDGTYTHSVILSNKDSDNLFSFSTRDNSSDNTIAAGSYTLSPTGSQIGHFSVHVSASTVVSDAVNGTLTVSHSGDNHVFNFSGYTADENSEILSVTVHYSGKLNRK